MRRKTEEIDLLASAFLAGEGKMQIEIAESLNLSQATVSRLLKVARGKYLKEEVHFLKEKVDDEKMGEILRRVSRQGIKEKLDAVTRKYAGKEGPFLRVFPSGNNEENRIEEFSRQAAPYIKDLLLRTNTCGVAWGLTIGGIVSVIKENPSPPSREKNPIRIVPLCGEMLGDLPTELASSILVADLEKVLNGGERSRTLSLSMVPAFIPDVFTTKEVKAIWKLIGYVKDYDLIFGSRVRQSGKEDHQVPLIEKLDMILTSVGAPENVLSCGKDSLLQASGVDDQELKKLVIGDIAGIFIARPGLSKSNKAKLDHASELWTGIRKEHLEICAERSRSGDRKKAFPGVVVVAAGREKADCLLEVLKLGLINTLVIDNSLEEELDRLIKHA